MSWIPRQIIINQMLKLMLLGAHVIPRLSHSQRVLRQSVVGRSIQHVAMPHLFARSIRQDPAMRNAERLNGRQAACCASSET